MGVEKSNPPAEFLLRSQPGLPVGFQLYMVCNDLMNLVVFNLRRIPDDSQAAMALKMYTNQDELERECLLLLVGHIRVTAEKMLSILAPDQALDMRRGEVGPTD